jgi:hypothetical protein
MDISQMRSPFRVRGFRYPVPHSCGKRFLLVDAADGLQARTRQAPAGPRIVSTTPDGKWCAVGI